MNPPTVNARALVRDAASLFAAFLVASILSAIGWFAFGSGSASPDATRKPTHMHCPACHEEISYSQKMVGKKCANCPEGAVYKATVGSIFDEDRDDDSGAGRIILFGLAVVVGIQSLAFAGMWRLKMLRERAANARNR